MAADAYVTLFSSTASEKQLFGLPGLLQGSPLAHYRSGSQDYLDAAWQLMIGGTGSCAALEYGNFAANKDEQRERAYATSAPASSENSTAFLPGLALGWQADKGANSPKSTPSVSHIHQDNTSAMPLLPDSAPLPLAEDPPESQEEQHRDPDFKPERQPQRQGHHGRARRPICRHRVVKLPAGSNGDAFAGTMPSTSHSLEAKCVMGVFFLCGKLPS